MRSTPRPSAIWLSLLLTAAGCAPGEGSRPPDRPILFDPIGPVGGMGPLAGGAGGAGGPPPAAVAGMVAPSPPQAGRAGAPAGVGVPPAGRGGAGMVASGTGGTAPLPDGGLSEFDGGSEPNRNLVRAGQLCERSATLHCAGEAHCCANPGRTFEQCRSESTKACTEQLFLDDVANKQVSGFGAAQAATAFENLEMFARTCDPNVVLWPLQETGLRGVYQGTVQPNQPCPPTGIRSPANYGAALASCTQISTHACLFTGDGPLAAPTSTICAPRADVGATCFVHTNCKDGMYCANPQMTYSAGTCTVSKAVGAACSSGEECAKQTCVSGTCAEPTAQSAWCLKP